MNGLKKLLRSWFLAFLLPKPIVGIFYLPRYIRQWRHYRRIDKLMSVKFSDSYPCLTDWVSDTPFDAHYFYQGAWLGREVARVQPTRHVDIGSSVMSVAVLSGFVDTVFVDYRPLKANLNGLSSVASDILQLPFKPGSLLSLSCLHVIEHIGLGRYGDPTDPEGSLKAAAELESVLSTGGFLYLSLPVGRARVCFNAHRVHAPGQVTAMFARLKLISFSYVDDQGRFMADASMHDAEDLDYGCGMFVFQKSV